MELESQTVIDVEAEEIDYHEQESIECWYTAAQIQNILGLNKAALQKAIAKLQNIELKALRRGSAPSLPLLIRLWIIQIVTRQPQRF
jgi:Fic family protein